MRHIVFLTSHLPQVPPQRVLTGMDAPFTWDVHYVGLQFAGFLTADVVRRRVSAVCDVDVTRDLVHATHGSQSLAIDLTREPLTVHAKCPSSDGSDEIVLTADDACNASFCMQVAVEGTPGYDHDSHRRVGEGIELWPQIKPEAYAVRVLYTGVERTRAEVAWHLRVQDQLLRRDCAVQRREDNLDAWCMSRSTLRGKEGGP
ncbi:DUF6513 domain-containing protein [Azohydromonas australica]|uniref:DUF6513 domain-containing protein n=1 Tax=Azohydromonas australica TaxID=364039 RepID=UPI0003FCCF6A|nr:DUF6513 domain-containing protein [Azohydromonas australica]